MPTDAGTRPAMRTWRELVELAGVSTAARILGVWGGRRVYFPTYHTVMMSERNSRIRQGYLRGMSRLELARQFSLSESRIYQIIRGKP